MWARLQKTSKLKVNEMATASSSHLHTNLCILSLPALSVDEAIV